MPGHRTNSGSSSAVSNAMSSGRGYISRGEGQQTAVGEETLHISLVPETLKECCLVAKSWIPRTRKHLFADIRFRTLPHLKLWKKTFPNSENSPAYHTRTLFVGCAEVDMTAGANEGGRIQAFSGVTSLKLDSHSGLICPQVSLVPFHMFSPTLKSLHTGSIIVPSPQLNSSLSFFPPPFSRT